MAEVNGKAICIEGLIAARMSEGTVRGDLVPPALVPQSICLQGFPRRQTWSPRWHILHTALLDKPSQC